MKKIKKLYRGLMLGLVFWLFPGMAEAAVPNPTDDFYVNDYAGVLSDSTKNDIIDKNIELEDSSGAQIVVVTTDSYGSQDGGSYTEDMFDDWGIGSAQENNGLLLVLFIEDDDYYALQGSGITNVLSDSVIDDILYDTLEPYFAAQEYDQGVAAVFNEFYGVMADYYGTNTAGSGTGTGGNEPVAAADQMQGSGVFGTIVGIIVMFVLIWLFFRLMSRLFRPRNYGGGYAGGGNTGGAFLGGFFLGRMRRPWGFGRRRRFGAPPPPPGPGGPGRGAPPPGGAGRMNTPPGGAGRQSGGGTSGGGLFGGGGGTSSGSGAGRRTGSGSTGSSRSTSSGRTSSPTFGSSGNSRSTGSGRSSSPGFGGGASRGGGGRSSGGGASRGGGRSGGGGRRR